MRRHSEGETSASQIVTITQKKQKQKRNAKREKRKDRNQKSCKPFKLFHKISGIMNPNLFGEFQNKPQIEKMPK